MAIDESTPSEKSRFAWIEGEANVSLDAFLNNHLPSKTKRLAGGDGWIWVISAAAKGRSKEPSEESLRHAKELVETLTKRLQDIEESTMIPKIKSKTSGPSKKMVKETAAQTCEAELRKLGQEWPCGKWMFFEGEDYIDKVFVKLAHSVVHGPLSKLKAKCTTIKVATADSMRSDGGRGPQQLVCVYFEDVWSEEDAKEVLECLVKEHGEIPSSAKADLYTMIGLDSKHPSRIRSTLYRPAELFNWDVLREWQVEYRQRIAKKKDKDTPPPIKRNDGQQSPVAPEEYWPVTKEMEGSKKQKYVPTGDDDSETESESGDTEVKPVQPVQQQPTTPVKKTLPEPLASIERDKIARASRSPVIKQTPVVTLRAKKRDRFGRSDF